MLILTRRIGEAVIIGDNEINFTILGIKGNQVRLGFVASKDISIHRNEIYDKIQCDKNQVINALEAAFKNPSHRELTH